MTYGSVLKYPYIDYETTHNEKGEEITVEVEKTLDLKFSLTTLTKYHDYVGRDLLSDMAKLSRKANKLQNVSADTDIEDMTEEDIDALFSISDALEFYGDLVAAMVCTYHRTKNLDFEEVRDEIPFSLLQNNDFIEKVMNLVSFGIKKN